MRPIEIEDAVRALEATGIPSKGNLSFVPAPGSANSSPVKEALKKEIAKIIDGAFTAGFNADNAGSLDHFDGFALAEAAIEKHWLNSGTHKTGKCL